MYKTCCLVKEEHFTQKTQVALPLLGEPHTHTHTHSHQNVFTLKSLVTFNTKISRQTFFFQEKNILLKSIVLFGSYNCVGLSCSWESKQKGRKNNNWFISFQNAGMQRAALQGVDKEKPFKQIMIKVESYVVHNRHIQNFKKEPGTDHQERGTSKMTFYLLRGSVREVKFMELC